jgi:hypothetical protein
MTRLDWRRARKFTEREQINDPRPGRLEQRADRYLAAMKRRERVAGKPKRRHRKIRDGSQSRAKFDQVNAACRAYAGPCPWEE